MADFQPTVTVERESSNISFTITGTDEMNRFSRNEGLKYVIDGTAKIQIDLCGYVFINSEVEEKFNTRVEEFKVSLRNAPDNFDDNDREQIKAYVEELLNSYFETKKLK
jgi:hypothetical protein